MKHAHCSGFVALIWAFLRGAMMGVNSVGLEDRYTFGPKQDRPRIASDPLRKAREKLQARLAEQIALAKEIQKNPAKEHEKQRGRFFWRIDKGYAIEPRYGTKIIELHSDPTQQIQVPDIKDVISTLSQLIDDLKKRDPDLDQALMNVSKRKTKSKNGDNTKSAEPLAISDHSARKSKS